MADYIPDITVDQVIDALKAFLQPFVPGGEIVRGQANRVPMPSNPCVVLTEMSQTNLGRSIFQNSPVFSTLQSSIIGPTNIDVQVDFYGTLAGDYCRSVENAFACGYAYDAMTASVKPLYASNGIQSPLVTGEQQYESRWTLTASLQYNPVVTLPQQSAIEASATLYPPVGTTEPT